MPLSSFGHLIIDWSKVYMVRVTKREFGHDPDEVIVFVDFPDVKLNAPAFTAIHGDAQRVWEHIKGDERFVVLQNEFAIDKSKIVAMTRPIRDEDGSIWIALGERGCTIPVNADLARSLAKALVK